MKVKITLPESIEDITLDQYQKFDALTRREDLNDIEYNKRVIKIFTGLKYQEVDAISFKDYEDILIQIGKALNQESEFKQRFKIKGVEFGFHPNLDNMQTSEYVDLKTIGMDVENYHKVMAILFRPIIQSDGFKNYKIANYEGTKQYADVMKQMPMSIVKGAFVFFYHLSSELRKHIQKSTKVEHQRVTTQQTILKNGGGTQQLAT